jgi:hypothetical protein
VELWALRDGWAVFPDLYAAHRRWLWIGALGCVLFVGSASIPRFGSRGVGTAVLLLVVARIADGRTTSRAKRLKDQINLDAVTRAGGVDSIKWATSTGGRYAQTAGEMNIPLNALGRTDPVISAKSVASATVLPRRLHAVADIELDRGDRVSYRV